MNNYEEKAKELLDKFFNITTNFNLVDYGKQRAKDCASIAIDEIIFACEYNHVDSYNSDWWEKVRASLNAL